MKVLIAEDDMNIRAGVEELLHKEGYQVVATSNGREALDSYQNSKPDFLILDIMMPDVDGNLVLKFIKQNPDISGIPVIMLTARGEGDDIIEGYQKGADYYIPKPFSTKQLLYGIKLFLKD